MKYLIILLLLVSSKVFSQAPPPPISQRSNGQVTLLDPNLFISRSFRPPVFLDTTEANLSNTLDSSGKIIYTFVGNKLWYRGITKAWLAVGSGSGGGSSFDSTYIYALVNTKMDQDDTTIVRKGGIDTIWGKKRFVDTVKMTKPFIMETTSNANVSLFETRWPDGSPGGAFPWFSITGGTPGSKIIMGANNESLAADQLRIVADYTDTIWTGQYRPLYLDVYDYLTLRGNRSGSSDSAIRFVAGGNINDIGAYFDLSGRFTSIKVAGYKTNLGASFGDRSFTDKNYVDSAISANAGGGGGGGTLTNITANSNVGQTWTITGTTVKNLDLVLTAYAVQLGNADNTSDINKPVSTAQQTALNLKANLASPAFTGTVTGITAAMVGLGNVDNTSDITKNSAVATITNKNFNSVTNTWPTFNQNTTGSAAKWTSGITISIIGDVTYSSPAFDGTTGVSGTATVTRLNGVSLAGLSTGILKITTGTGLPSIAVAADFPALNQNTTGSAAKLTTARNINTVPFDGTANITVTAAANTLTGTSLASGIVSSSLTSVGTLATLTVTAPIAGSVTGNAANLSGTPLLPNGTTVALQTASDSSLKLANTRYVNQAVGLAKDSIQAGTDLYISTAGGYNILNYRNGYTRMITSGSATTVADTVKNVIFNPTSVLASHTITLPANPEDNCIVTIQAILNSTTTAGSAVVTSLTISPNAGQTILQTSAPTAIVSGASYVYKFNASTSIWIRQIY